MAWTVNKKRQEKRIDSPDGASFIIIQKLSQGDKDDRMDVLATMEIKGKTKEQLANMNLGKMKHFERLRSIKEWNLTDESGSGVLPINDENVRNLPEEVITALDDAIEELNPEGLPDATKKP